MIKRVLCFENPARLSLKLEQIVVELPLDGHNLQSERFREQIEASEPLKKQMWQQTVVAKILGQAHVLGTQHIEHHNMLKWAKDVRSGDTDNMEVRAAAYYWRNMFGR